MLPVIAVLALVIVAFVGSKGPYPKINVFKEEKTFFDAKTGPLAILKLLETKAKKLPFLKFDWDS